MNHDMPPMPSACPHHPQGAHKIDFMFPEDESSLTLFCVRCGAIRRVPMSGELPRERPLDDCDADEILRAARTRSGH